MREFRNAKPADATRCFEIEIDAYEGDEAATLEKISKRIEVYPNGFLVLLVEGEIVGFVNCGCAHEVEMSDEEFKELVGHDPDAPNVVIMSVVVDPAHQGKGLSRALMVEFVGRMKRMGKSTIHLMCKEHHVPLYENFGYSYLQPSTSDHGGMTWHEMAMKL
ncbi:GNAT family N-acetyltransferase [Ruegeria faecimaris]|uniref:GNAT family N-acetyltransferase n=1 Tax=Ruegeria faecimaris TaxID=686389 RepID=UPI002493CD9F|nr:GNAT family N-acetyltransferase [Ruegeria faecimaris]